MSNQWREEQHRCQRQIERHQEADKSYLDKGVALLDLARNAQSLFAMQEPREKRRLLNFVLSNCSWEDGEVVATFREPFDLLAETAERAARGAGGEAAKLAKTEIWLRGMHATARLHHAFRWHGSDVAAGCVASNRPDEYTGWDTCRCSREERFITLKRSKKACGASATALARMSSSSTASPTAR
jgi:hypothetical protein